MTSNIVVSKDKAGGPDTSYSERTESGKKYQEETENMGQVVASIDSNIMQVRTLHEQALASTHGYTTESDNLRELCDLTNDKFAQVRARLVALGEENRSFKENHSEHTSMIEYRVHVYQSFIHRFVGVIQEWENTNVLIQDVAKGFVDDSVEKLLSNSTEGEDKAPVERKDDVLLNEARACMKIVREFEERLNFIHQLDTDVKNIMVVHRKVDENGDPEIREAQVKVDIPHVEEPETDCKCFSSRMRISWAAVPVIIITVALVIGLLTRFNPQWYKRNILDKPTAISSGKESAKMNIVPVDLVQLFGGNRILQN